MRAADRQGTLGGSLLSLVAAGLGVATAFGIHITTQEHAAILTFCGAVAVVAPLVGALFDHAKAVVAPVAPVAPPTEPSPAELIQAQIDALEAQKEALRK